jgi:hypothetical protein
MKSAKELRKMQDDFLERSKTTICLQKIASKIIEDIEYLIEKGVITTRYTRIFDDAFKNSLDIACDIAIILRDQGYKVQYHKLNGEICLDISW